MDVKATSHIGQQIDALRRGAAVLLRPDSAAPIAVRGADRADFLQRMTTNDISALRTGQAAVTVLTTPTAHIRFVFTVLCREDDLLLLPAPGQSAALAAHLRSQVFFMDKVEIASAGGARIRVMGPAAGEILSATGFRPADTSDNSWWEANGAIVMQQERYDIPGFELLPANNLDLLTSTLAEQGAVALTDDAAYTARRVELGRPAPGHELVEEYNPLEAGLAWACAGNKGCYTGQEIIARQTTYDKVTKNLVGLLCEGAVAAGDDITADGRTAGKVTSAAGIPDLDRRLALAIVRRPHNEAGARVDVHRAGNHIARAEIAEIPFG